MFQGVKIAALLHMVLTLLLSSSAKAELVFQPCVDIDEGLWGKAGEHVLLAEAALFRTLANVEARENKLAFDDMEEVLGRFKEAEALYSRLFEIESDDLIDLRRVPDKYISIARKLSQTQGFSLPNSRKSAALLARDTIKGLREKISSKLGEHLRNPGLIRVYEALSIRRNSELISLASAMVTSGERDGCSSANK